MSLIGDRIQALRQVARLSQSGLGRLIGKDAKYISKLERGVLTNITTETLESLAEHLYCQTDYLLGRRGAYQDDHANYLLMVRQLEREGSPVLQPIIDTLKALEKPLQSIVAPLENPYMDLRSAVRRLADREIWGKDAGRQDMRQQYLRQALAALKRLRARVVSKQIPPRLAQAVPHIDRAREAILEVLQADAVPTPLAEVG
jgi:transcriptional regulator with XRE-family HTH domain